MRSEQMYQDFENGSQYARNNVKSNRNSVVVQQQYRHAKGSLPAHQRGNLSVSQSQQNLHNRAKQMDQDSKNKQARQYSNIMKQQDAAMQRGLRVARK